MVEVGVSEINVDVDGLLADTLGELADSVHFEPLFNEEATASVTTTPLWESLKHQINRAFPACKIIPSLMVGGTDARFFRRKDTVAYGAGTTYTQKSLTSGTLCTNAVFGDPAPGVVKSCYFA